MVPEDGVVDGVLAPTNNEFLVTRLVWWDGVDEDGEGDAWSGVVEGVG